MNMLINNAMVFVLELLLQVFSNTLPESIRFQHSVTETIESGESCKTFMNGKLIDNLKKSKKCPTRAGP